MSVHIDGTGGAHVPGSATELGADAVALLRVLYDADEPVGARVAHRLLVETYGRTLSEASVSRVMLKVDSLGLTEAVGRKGRTLTASGRRLVESTLTSQDRQEKFTKALDLRSIQEILDWLRARRAIEVEVASLAARRISAESLADLKANLRQHRHLVERRADPTPTGMFFHELLLHASASPLFEALSGSLHSPAQSSVERALDVITGGRGTIGHSPDEHEQILIAVAAGDGAAAETAMRKHLTRLIDEVEEFSMGTLGDILPRLIAAIEGDANPDSVPQD
jgi:DNA-binding FadR family transcriptional regulator